MASGPVKAASVGLGRWSKVIATAVGRSDKLEIVSCFDVIEDNVNAFSQQFGCEKASSYEELLADDRIEAILCTTPNHHHLETISKAAEAGKAVYTEKPIAHTVADGRKIAEAVAKAGVTFCVGHSARMLGASRMMKEQVDSGALGNITFYEGNWSNERALELTPEKWRYFREYTPGGPLIQLLVHHFDTMQYILGPVAEVQAYTRRLQTKAEVDDVAALICEFEDGYLGYVGSSWVSPGIYWMNIYGTEANLYHELDFRYWTDPEVDKYTTLFRHPHGTSERTALNVPMTDMFKAELENFANAFQTGGKPEVGAKEALQALAVVEAGIISSKEKRPVKISELLG
jgi:predicted dehydrogenase